MTPEEVQRAIEGLWAYDSGADSGIYDEDLRARLRTYMASLSSDERRRELSIVMRSLLTDEALDVGYGWEDARALGDWFDEQFGVG